MAPKKKKNQRLLDAAAFAMLTEIEKQRAIRLNDNYYVVYPKKLQPEQLKIIKEKKDYNESEAKTKRNEAKNALREDVTINDFKGSNQMMGQFMLNGSKLLEKDWRLFRHASTEMDWVKKSMAALNNTLSEGLAEFINENGSFNEKAYMEKINTAFDEFITAAQNYADNRNPSSSAGKRRRRRVVDLLNNAKQMKRSMKTIVDSIKEGAIEFDKMDANTKAGLNSWNLVNQISSNEVAELEWQNQGNSTDVYRIKLKGDDGNEYYLKENLPFLNENLQGFLSRRMKQLEVSQQNKKAGGDPNKVEERISKITDADYANCNKLLSNLSNALSNASDEKRDALADKFSSYFAHNFDDIFAELEIYNTLVGVKIEGNIDEMIANAENALEKQALRMRKMVLEESGRLNNNKMAPTEKLTAAQWMKMKLNLNEKDDKVFYDSIKNLSDKEMETLFRVTLGKEVELFGQMSAKKMQNGDDKAAINNTATSRVAEHLGFDDVITKSKTMLVKFTRRDGTAVNQLCTVCEAAKGLELIDLMKMAEQTGKKIVYSPEASRQLLRLQAADTLTLQKDRHGRNFKCDHYVDKQTGNIVIKTVKAYDNDMSFDAVSLAEAFNEPSGEPQRNQFLPAMDTVVKKDSALYKFVLGHYFGVDTVTPPRKAEIPIVKIPYSQREVDLTNRGGLSFGPRLTWTGEGYISSPDDIRMNYKMNRIKIKKENLTDEDKAKISEEINSHPEWHINKDLNNDENLINYSLQKYCDISNAIEKIWYRPKKEQDALREAAKQEGKTLSRDNVFFKTNLTDEQIMKLGDLVDELEKLESQFDFTTVADKHDNPIMDCFIKSVKYMYRTVYGDNIDIRMAKEAKNHEALKSLINKDGDLEIPSLLHYDHEAYKSLQKSVAEFKDPNSLIVHKLKELGLSQDKISALAARNEEMLNKIEIAQEKAQKFYQAAGWTTKPKNKFFLDKEDYKDLDNLTDYAIDPGNTYLAVDNDNYLTGQNVTMFVNGEMKSVPFKDLMNESERLKAEKYNDQIKNDEKRWKYKDEEKANKQTYNNNTADYSSVSTNAVEYVNCCINDNVYSLSHDEFKDKQKFTSKVIDGLFNKRLKSEITKMEQPIKVDKVREMRQSDSKLKTAFKAEYNSVEGKIFAEQIKGLSEELYASGNYKKMTETSFDNLVNKGFENSMMTVFNKINDPNVADKNAKIDEIASTAKQMKSFAKKHGITINQENMLSSFMEKNPNAFTPEQANKLKAAMKPAPAPAPEKKNPGLGAPGMN